MYWWLDKNIEIVEINGELYALYGWNGEKYNHCWKCADRYNAIDEDIEYVIKPVYQESPDGNFDIIGYEIQ